MKTMQGQTSIGHTPGQHWTFDTSVTQCFHDMLFRSIPQLEVMRQAVHGLGTSFVHAGDTIIDLGCSLGGALFPFIQRYGNSCSYIGLEISEAMLEVARARFSGMAVSDLYGHVVTPSIDIRSVDLRHAYPSEQAGLTLAILTLMFIPTEYRPQLMRRIWEHLRPGGALVFVEKVIGETAEIAELFIEQYHAFKAHQGYSYEDIARKALALEGILVPLTASSNEAMLKNAGFVQIECFWRWMNFVGWIAIK